MASEKDVLNVVLALTTDEQETADAADAWLAELDQRAREVENGTADLEDWAVVRERLTQRWRSASQR